MVAKYDRSWNIKIENCLLNPHFEYIDNFKDVDSEIGGIFTSSGYDRWNVNRIICNGLNIWIENRPYSAVAQDNHLGTNVRPSRVNIMKFLDAFDEWGKDNPTPNK